MLQQFTFTAQTEIKLFVTDGAERIKVRENIKNKRKDLDELNAILSSVHPENVNMSENNTKNAVTPAAEQSNLSEKEVVTPVVENYDDILTPEEHIKMVSSDGKDPSEIASLYKEEIKNAGYESLSLPWQQQLVGRRINKASFERFGDKNKLNGAIGKSWINKKGEETSNGAIDAMASELSEYGVEVTPDDIVQFMYDHPSNRINKGNDTTRALNERFKTVVKELTGEDVGGVDSNTGRIILAGIEAGRRSAEEQAALPFQGATIPDALVNFLDFTETNAEDFESFEDFSKFVEESVKNGIFDFPLSEQEYVQIKTIVNHGIEQERNWQDFSTRLEKARNRRESQPSIFEDAAKEATGNELQPIRDEEVNETEAVYQSYVDAVNRLLLVAKGANHVIVVRNGDEYIQSLKDAGASNDVIDDAMISLEDDGSVAYGGYIHSIDSIYLISENIPNKEELNNVWLHENIHRALDKLYGDDYVSELYNLYHSLGDEAIKQLVPKRYFEEFDKRSLYRLADEYLAFLSAELTRGQDVISYFENKEFDKIPDGVESFDIIKRCFNYISEYKDVKINSNIDGKEGYNEVEPSERGEGGDDVNVNNGIGKKRNAGEDEQAGFNISSINDGNFRVEKEVPGRPNTRADSPANEDSGRNIEGSASIKDAISSAEKYVDTNPTDAQKEAGNYKKGHIRLNGFDITIEQPAGSVRSGKDASGKEWSVTMQNTYGYIRGTEGVDGDHIDVFIGSNPGGSNVFVVDQVNPDGSFDEHKVMIGFGNMEDARTAYLSNYEKGWMGLGNITGVSVDDFRAWIESSTRKKKPFSAYTKFTEFVQKEAITIDDIDSFEGDEVQKRMAKGHLEGRRNDINTLAYEHIKNKINERDRSRLLQSDSGRATAKNEVNAEAVSPQSGRDGRSGGRDKGKADRSEQGAILFDNEESGLPQSSSERDGAGDGGNVGRGSDLTVQGRSPGDVDSNTVDSQPGGGSDVGGSRHTDGRGRDKANEDASRDAKERRDRVSDLNKEKDDALNDLKNALKDLRDAGRDSLSISVVGLNPKQIEATMRVISSGARYGYALVKEGVVKLSEWTGKMKQTLSPSFKSMDFSDKEISSFISDMWDAEVPNESGVYKSIRQWAEELGMPKTKEIVRLSLIEKRKRQIEAEGVPTNTGNLDNIRESLPFLLPEQHEDVQKAEIRFFSPANKTRELAYGKGMMFTNGTGTGKTYVGLGVIKRMVKQGKKNILIVVPSQNKVADWIKDGANLGLNISALKNTKSAGEGVVITTYANFGVNKALFNREFDLVAYDESHRLMENKDGKSSSRTSQHYLISNKNERSALKRLQNGNELWIEEDAILKEISKIDTTKDDYKPENREKLNERLKEIKHKQADVLPDLESRAKKASDNTKVLFLSATPFKDHYNLRYVEQYLFSYPEKEKHGYNDTNSEEQFFIENFGAGYKIRYNGLEKSGENAELVSRQEIEFSEKLTSLGVMSGRMINSEMDYSRDFPTVTGFNADTFNDALNDVFNYNDNAAFKSLQKSFADVFRDYNYSTKLFEVLKTSASIDRIKKHLSEGRKIVVFHRRRQGDSRPPFNYALDNAFEFAKGLDDRTEEGKANKARMFSEIDLFKEKYSSLLVYENELNYLSTPEQLKDVFGDTVVTLNGDVSTKDKQKAVEDFNDDDSGIDIIVIQEESGKEGISLHDTTGKHQRVLINMALPISSITALQIEGRIYRIGNETNAIFEYPLLGLDLETYHFGSKLNKKLSTTENLAMGNLARDLLSSFANGVLEQRGDIDTNSQGTGGKEYDKRVTTGSSSLFDKAVLAYYSTIKRTQKTKSKEGIDYFPTPEPIGLKMVEWGKAKEGENFLEPSAGHGAIARWVPTENKLTAIEPSSDLFSKLNVSAGGGVKNIIQQRFEDYHIVNKHDVVVMNPPFGTNSKTAADHVEKAFVHLRDGGRLIAIVPDGASMNKRLDKFLYGENEKGKLLNPSAILRAEVLLPSVTFERAGTNVVGKIVIIDKIEGDKNDVEGTERVDLRYVKDVKDLFDRIQYLEMPKRVEQRFVEEVGKSIIRQSEVSNKPMSLFEEVSGEKDTRDDSDVFIVRTKAFLGDKFYPTVQLARENKGEYSKNKKGFLFRDKESASVFRDSANSTIFIKDNPLYRSKNDRIDKLRNSKPIEITGEEYSGKYELERSGAKRWLKDNLRGSYVNKDTGEQIAISKVGINEVTSHGSQNEAHLKSFVAIPKLIEESIFIDEIPNEKSNERYDSYRYYVAGLKIGGEDYTAKIVVGVKGDSKYYDHRLTEIEKGALINNLNGLSNSVAENQNSLSDIKDTKLLSILQTEKEKIATEVENLSSSLNTTIHIIRDVNDIVDEAVGQQTKKRGSKGWYDPKTGEVYFVLDNAENVADAQATILHETVGHKGLRGLLGEGFNTVMGNVFDSLPKYVQSSLMNEYGDRTVSAEEYCAHMAETMSDPGIIQRICSSIKKAFRSMGIDFRMTDGDIMYMLWKSKNRMQDSDTAFDVMNKITKEEGVKSTGKEYDVLFRSNNPIDKYPVSIEKKIDMESDVQSMKEKLYEGYVDGMVSVNKLQKLISEKTGRDIPDYANVWMYENTVSSIDDYEKSQFKYRYADPLSKAIKKLTQLCPLLIVLSCFTNSYAN